MEWVVISALGVVTAVTTILGCLAIYHRHRDPTAWSFAIIMLAVAGWAGGIGFFLTFDMVDVMTRAVQVYYISAALIALAIFYLALSVARKIYVVRHWLYVLLALPFVALAWGFIVAPEIYITSIQPGVVTLNPWGYFMYSVYFLAYYGSALALLAFMVRRSRGIEMMRFRYLLVGYSLGGMIGIAFNLILPAFGNYQYVWAGPLGLFIFVPMVYVTIVKYGLFDIRQAAARTTAYVSTLGIIAVFYAFVVTNLSNVIADNTVAQTLIILAAALSFQPLKRFFDNLTDTIFYKNTYHASQFYAKFSEQLTSTTDLRTLLKHTAELVHKTLKSQQAFLIVYGSGDQYITAGTNGHAKIPYADAAMLDGSDEDIIIAEASNTKPEVRRMLQSHRLSLVLRLKAGKKVMGYLCLGDHLTSYFSVRDLKVLETIADSLVIAVQNAVSLHEVRELNDTLQQRIDNATKELRRSNAQLHRLDEAKDEFISMASHQLRTPLTSIKGYISMLMEGDVGRVSPEQKHVLNEAFVSSERMVRLIGDFLNVSRLQTGKFVIEKRPVDLALLVQREIEALMPNAAARGVKFIYKKPKNIPMLELDENKIQQVVMNFSDNAIYYSKDKGEITVSLKKGSDYVEFTVKDNGIGVPKDEQAHLFNKFFRATNARRARPDGTGVGLFLAKKVITDHDGSIIFKSTQGRGSTFGFRLPLK